MTPTEFSTAMQGIKEKYETNPAYGPDPEMAHIFADDLMCELLSELGYKDGVEIFNSMELWYS